MYDDERPRRSLFSRLLGGLDGLRRFLVNVLFFGLLAGLLIASLGGKPKVPDGAALMLKPRGTIVEQLSPVDPVERFVSRNTGAGAAASETLLKDLVDALRFAKDDARIKAVYLDTNDMAGAGLVSVSLVPMRLCVSAASCSARSSRSSRRRLRASSSSQRS